MNARKRTLLEYALGGEQKMRLSPPDSCHVPESVIFSAPKPRHSAMPSEPGNVRFSVRCLWQFSTHSGPIRSAVGSGMRRMSLLFPAIMLAACGSVSVSPFETSPAVPQSVALVDKIEAQLANDPCVGSLARWARHYRWRMSPDGWDRTVVEIDLRQAGVFGFRQGRYIHLPQTGGRPADIIIMGDERRYLVAFASYDVRLDRLTMESCGPNRRD